jgi:hypothetical protein
MDVAHVHVRPSRAGEGEARVVGLAGRYALCRRAASSSWRATTACHRCARCCPSGQCRRRRPQGRRGHDGTGAPRRSRCCRQDRPLARASGRTRNVALRHLDGRAVHVEGIHRRGGQRRRHGADEAVEVSGPVHVGLRLPGVAGGSALDKAASCGTPAPAVSARTPTATGCRSTPIRPTVRCCRGSGITRKEDDGPRPRADDACHLVAPAPAMKDLAVRARGGQALSLFARRVHRLLVHLAADVIHLEQPACERTRLHP